MKNRFPGYSHSTTCPANGRCAEECECGLPNRPIVVTPETPEALSAMVYDAETGELLHHITRINTDTGIAKGWVHDENGAIYKSTDGAPPKIQVHDNKVIIRFA